MNYVIESGILLLLVSMTLSQRRREELYELSNQDGDVFVVWVFDPGILAGIETYRVRIVVAADILGDQA